VPVRKTLHVRNLQLAVGLSSLLLAFCLPNQGGDYDRYYDPEGNFEEAVQRYRPRMAGTAGEHHDGDCNT
jgi:hypothetical protein